MLPAVELNGILEEKIGAKIPRFQSPKSVAAVKRVLTEDRWERWGEEEGLADILKDDNVAV